MYPFLGGVYLQCHWNDPPDPGEVRVPTVGPSDRMVHGFVLHGADPGLRHLHVLHHQGQHQAGTVPTLSSACINFHPSNLFLYLTKGHRAKTGNGTWTGSLVHHRQQTTQTICSHTHIYCRVSNGLNLHVFGLWVIIWFWFKVEQFFFSQNFSV